MSAAGLTGFIVAAGAIELTTAAGLAGLTTAAGAAGATEAAGAAAVAVAAALVRCAMALRRACSRAWLPFVPRLARGLSAGLPGGSAGKGGGVWAHKLQPVRNKVRSAVFTVIWRLGLPI